MPPASQHSIIGDSFFMTLGCFLVFFQIASLFVLYNSKNSIVVYGSGHLICMIGQPFANGLLMLDINNRTLEPDPAPQFFDCDDHISGALEDEPNFLVVMLEFKANRRSEVAFGSVWYPNACISSVLLIDGKLGML